MATKKTTIKAEWNEELEKKIENKVNKREKSCGSMCKSSNAGGGAVYGLGFLGALVYYIQTANSFWEGIFGVLQVIF